MDRTGQDGDEWMYLENGACDIEWIDPLMIHVVLSLLFDISI